MSNSLSSAASLSARVYMNDFLASIVVFLVALPLCMGISIASGVPPANGLITGIVGGLVAGVLSGCPLQVSGPAAGLVVVAAELLRDQGLEKFAVMILIAGIFQIIAGLAHAAHIFRAVTPAIVHGMLAGIGVLIFASQFHVMVDDSPSGSGINNLLSIPGAIRKGLTPDSTSSHQEAALVGVSTIIVLFLWEKFAPRKLRLLPASLVAILVGSTIAAWYGLPIRHVELPDNLFQSVHWLSLSSAVSSLTNQSVLLGGLAIALMASAETLLTASAIDKMQNGARTNYDRELLAQGVGNVLCGWMGALPMTGVIVRSSVNVNAGAKTRLSAILHGLWLLLFITQFPAIVKLIPVPSLAALLVCTGCKLANFKVVKELSRFGKGEVVIYAATLICIVAVDLLTGVLVGIGLAVVKLVYAFAHLEVEVLEDREKNETDLWLSGAATFLNLPRFARALESVRPGTQLHIHFEMLDYIDHACLDWLMNWDKQHQESGGTVAIDWNALNAVLHERHRRNRLLPAGKLQRQRDRSVSISIGR